MTGSEMAKAGLLEQNRLSGANRNTLIAGGIMANTAEIFNFPVPDAAQKEPRVADLDDGYTRIANELLEAVMLAGLTQHQLLVFLAVMRKTYGFNKKLDWVSNEQLSELTGILPHKCSAAKSVLVKRGIFIQSGRNIGINNVVSEWSTLPESGKKNKVYLKEVNLPESGKKSLPKSGKGTYPNQVNTKDKLTKDNIKPYSSENSGESSDLPENDLPVVKADAAIQNGSKWGTAEDLTAAEWMLAFRENGITTMEQVNAGMRVARRQNRPFLPSPGQFVAWCREEASVIAGLPNVSELVDMVYEYCRKRGLYPDAESYPWKSNAHYWLVTNLYQNMRANALTDAELRRKAADELVHMTARINRGEAIPEPVKQLPVMGGRPLNRAQALAKIAEIKAKFGLKGASV
ncbi:replication protein [Escherichia coli]